MNSSKSENISLTKDHVCKSTNKASYYTKIGYIKINSVNGQVTFCVFKIGHKLMFNKPNIHKDKIKIANLVHLNVDNELFPEYSLQIKQYIKMLIKMFLDLDINDFILTIHKLHEFKKRD